MALSTSSLRKTDSNFPFIKDRIVTLVRITDKAVTQASTVDEKRKMLRSLSEEDTLLAVWTGKWSSDVFSVPSELLTRWKRDLLGDPG